MADNQNQNTKKIVFYEHPEFEECSKKWEILKDLYEGEHHKLISYEYLWPHELELSNSGQIVDPVTKAVEPIGQRIRRIRARRSRYLNVMEPVVSTLVSMAFGKPIVIEPAVQELFGEEIEDVDGKGTSLQSFIMGPLAIAYFLYGKPIIAVDAPGNDSQSRAEEIASGFRPFMDMLDLLEVPDWQLADVGPRTGKYDWLRYEFEVVAKRAGPTQEPKEVEYCKVWVIEDGSVYLRVYREDEEGEDWIFVEERILQGWDELPIAAIHNNESWLKDVAELQLTLFNAMSAYYNVLNSQAFQRIFIAGDLGEKHMISISEYGISQIPPDSKVFQIEPNSGQIHVNAIETHIELVPKVAFNRTRSLPSGSKEAPGADTIKEMNAELIAMLKQALEEMETAINEAIKFYAMFKLGPERGRAFAGKVILPKDIDVKSVTDRLELFMTYRDEIRKILPWRKAELRKAAAEMGYDEAMSQEIFKEIERLKDEPVVSPMAGFGAFANVNGSNGGQQQQRQPAAPAAQPGSKPQG